MNAKENKALAMAAVAVILLGQPAFARGGGLGGGFGAGFGGGTHGFGALGVHGFSGGYTPSMHGEGDKSMSENRPLAGANEDRPIAGDKCAPLAVAGQASANGVNANAASTTMPRQ